MKERKKEIVKNRCYLILEPSQTIVQCTMCTLLPLPLLGYFFLPLPPQGLSRSTHYHNCSHSSPWLLLPPPPSPSLVPLYPLPLPLPLPLPTSTTFTASTTTTAPTPLLGYIFLLLSPKSCPALPTSATHYHYLLPLPLHLPLPLPQRLPLLPPSSSPSSFSSTDFGYFSHC